MAELPYVRWYMSDWLGATRGMKAAEIGIYFTLLALMYERGDPLPEDNKRLARQCGCTPKTFSNALEMLIEDGKIDRLDSGLWNKRVQNEFIFRAEKSQQNSDAAKKRWGKVNKINDEMMRTQCERNADGMQARTLSQKPEAKVDTSVSTTGARKHQTALDPSSFPKHGFDEWWNAYPHKIGKGAAEKKWHEVRKAGIVSFDDLTAGLERYVQSKPPERSWCNPATWLHQKRWLDVEGPSVKPNGSGKVGFGETAERMINELREESRDIEISGDADEQPALPPAERI